MTARITIVGAGCAALGAATELVGQKQTAVDITLIDPNQWIGGRALTWPDPALPVDLGPQFIQDPEINPWAVILGQMPEYKNMDVTPILVDTLYRVQGGNKEWTTVFGNEGIAKGNDLLEKGYLVATAFKNEAILKANDAAIFKGQEDLRLSLGSSGYGAIAESAEPWQYIARDRDRQTEVASAGNIYVPGGLGNLVQNYGKKLLADNPLILHRLNQVVVAIDDGNPQHVTITTSDAQAFEADFCIVTVPSPAIGSIEFTPPLPGARTRADGFIRLGSYKKVAFRPKAFPQGEEDDRVKKKTEYYIYDSATDGVWQYFRLPTDPTILICVTAGDFAFALDQLADDKAAELIINLLGKAYANADFTPKDGKTVVSNWTNLATINGAYSYTRVDDQLDRDNPVPLEARLEIARPLGRIHFAGEATWPDAYGTIHGAYLSGVRSAREILAVLQST